MLESLLAYFQASPAALLGLTLILLLCGVGLPLPEDVVLISAGLLAGNSGHSWVVASVVMYIGVLAGDSLAFSVGHHFGLRILALPWAKRWLPDAKRHLIEKLFARYGSFVFFVARFLPGVRAGIFCIAGAMRASYARFIFFDGLAAVISVPLWVWFGHFLWGKFGNDLENLSRAVSRTRSYAIWATMGLVVVIAVVVYLVWRRKRKPA